MATGKLFGDGFNWFMAITVGAAHGREALQAMGLGQIAGMARSYDKGIFVAIIRS